MCGQAFTMNVEIFCHLQGFHSQIEFVQWRLLYVESSFLESANSDHNFTVKHQSDRTVNLQVAIKVACCIQKGSIVYLKV